MIADERRLLELIATAEEGCTEALLLGHGFAFATMFNVVKAGLATAQAERLHAAGQPVEIIRITDSGRRALANPPR
jgi:DNA-binding PadR family transcriptional regulator